MGNLLAGNDCGFYSVRGFAACLMTLCSLLGFLLLAFVALIVAVIENFFKILDMEAIEKNEEQED
jgi:hypothetical protein